MAGQRRRATGKGWSAQTSLERYGPGVERLGADDLRRPRPCESGGASTVATARRPTGEPAANSDSAALVAMRRTASENDWNGDERGYLVPERIGNKPKPFSRSQWHKPAGIAEVARRSFRCSGRAVPPRRPLHPRLRASPHRRRVGGLATEQLRNSKKKRGGQRSRSTLDSYRHDVDFADESLRLR